VTEECLNLGCLAPESLPGAKRRHLSNEKTMTYKKSTDYY